MHKRGGQYASRATMRACLNVSVLVPWSGSNNSGRWRVLPSALAACTAPAGRDPAPGQPDPQGEDWLVLRDRTGEARLAVQHVDDLATSTWPDAQVPQQLHLDLTVSDIDELAVQRDRALSLGANVLLDRSADPDEPLYVFADPAGHPFCIFFSPDHPS